MNMSRDCRRPIGWLLSKRAATHRTGVWFASPNVRHSEVYVLNFSIDKAAKVSVTWYHYPVSVDFIFTRVPCHVVTLFAVTRAWKLPSVRSPVDVGNRWNENLLGTQHPGSFRLFKNWLRSARADMVQSVLTAVQDLLITGSFTCRWYFKSF